MFCPRCGVESPPNRAFCGGCGAQLAADAGTRPHLTQPVQLTRPGVITLLAVLQFIGATGGLLVGLAVAASALGADASRSAAWLAVLFIGVAALQLTCGLGLWKLKPYGRKLQIGFAAFGLLGVPIGTIISILVLVYLYKPGVKAIFSGKAPSEFTQAEILEIKALSQGSGVVTALVVAGVVIAVVFVGGIIAAIAIPGLLRARMSGNEASAIGALRGINSAQASYAAAGRGGYAVSLATLSAPCPGSSQGFIAPDLSRDPSTRSGFTIALASRNADAGSPDCNGRATQVGYYAAAVPVTVGVTGIRGFAMSETGTIFFDPTGRAPTASAMLAGTARPLE